MGGTDACQGRTGNLPVVRQVPEPRAGINSQKAMYIGCATLCKYWAHLFKFPVISLYSVKKETHRDMFSVLHIFCNSLHSFALG